MVALATRMWEGLKKEEKLRKREAKFSFAEKSTLHHSNSVPLLNRGKRAPEKEQPTDQKNSPRRFDSKLYPKEFASGVNEKGDKILLSLWKHQAS
ncbi:hypothetical protein V1517DRAFT_340551, partial [Lipomyces orientalis]